MVWRSWGVRVAVLLGVFGVGYAAGVVAPGWVSAQPANRNDWPAGAVLTATDINRLAERVQVLEMRVNTPVLGAPTSLGPVTTDDPVTFPAIATPSLVTLVPGGSGFGQITFSAFLGASVANGRVARVTSPGDSAVVVLPANTQLTVDAVLGTGASPAVNINRYPLNN